MNKIKKVVNSGWFNSIFAFAVAAGFAFYGNWFPFGIALGFGVQRLISSFKTVDCECDCEACEDCEK